MKEKCPKDGDKGWDDVAAASVFSCSFKFELDLVPFPIPQVGKLRPGVEVERNVHVWVGPQGLAGQELTGFGCSLFEQRPLSKCRGRKAVCQPLRAWGQPD